jgi:hypothetical protein
MLGCDLGTHIIGGRSGLSRRGRAKLVAIGVKEGGKEEDEGTKREKWMAWMSMGRREGGVGHSDIVMREKEEFGGIPRMER